MEHKPIFYSVNVSKLTEMVKAKDALDFEKRMQQEAEERKQYELELIRGEHLMRIMHEILHSVAVIHNTRIELGLEGCITNQIGSIPNIEVFVQNAEKNGYFHIDWDGRTAESGDIHLKNVRIPIMLYLCRLADRHIASTSTEGVVFNRNEIFGILTERKYNDGGYQFDPNKFLQWYVNTL